MRRPIPTWEPLSPEVLADHLGAYDRMRGACPPGGWRRVPVRLR